MGVPGTTDKNLCTLAPRIAQRPVNHLSAALTLALRLLGVVAGVPPGPVASQATVWNGAETLPAGNPDVAKAQSSSVFTFMNSAQIADVTAGTWSVDVTGALNLALAKGGDLYFPEGTYRISRPLVISGNTRIRGAGIGRTILKLTPVTGATYLMWDSSMVTGSIANTNIIIEDIEFNGNNNLSASVTACLGMFRVSNLAIRRCYFHDTSGTNVQLFLSQMERNITITDCTAANAGTASTKSDAFAVGGSHVVLERCVARNFTDSGFAVLQDNGNRSGTNPADDFPHDITFQDCQAVGSTANTSTGFAFGGFMNFANRGDANYRVLHCQTSSCYANMSATTTNGLTVEGCDFGVPRIPDNGGIMINGCSNLTFRNNTVRSASAQGTGLCSALKFQADRFTGPAGAQDGNVANAKVVGNRFLCTGSNPAILVYFATANSNPTYHSSITDLWFENNDYSDPSRGIVFHPAGSSGPYRRVWPSRREEGKGVGKSTDLTTQDLSFSMSEKQLSDTGVLLGGTPTAALPATWTGTP